MRQRYARINEASLASAGASSSERSYRSVVDGGEEKILLSPSVHFFPPARSGNNLNDRRVKLAIGPSGKLGVVDLIARRRFRLHGKKC